MASFLSSGTPMSEDGISTGWLWPRYLPTGKLTLLVGNPGIGKSLLALDIAARISQGANWPDDTQARRGKVFLITAEDTIGDTIRPRLEVAGVPPGCEDIQYLKETYEDSTCKKKVWFDLQKHLDGLAALLPGYCLCIFDTLSAYLGGIDTNREAAVRGALSPVVDLAAQTNTAILGIAHLNKVRLHEGMASLTPALYRIIGSMAFVGIARSVLVVTVHPEDPDARVMLQIKANLAPRAGGLGFNIGERSITYSDGTTGFAPYIQWQGWVDMDADQVLNEASLVQQRSTKAMDWLGEYLVEPMSAEKIIAAAKKQGIPRRTLMNAKKKLGIESKKTGFGKLGVWHWMPA